MCPKKVTFGKYVKNTDFNDLINNDLDFYVRDCDSIYASFNQRILSPNVAYIGQINYDIKLVIDNSLEYKITDIKDGIDTISLRSGPGKWIIMNNIKSFIVNGHKLDNKNAPFSIDIPTKLGKVIKK